MSGSRNTPADPPVRTYQRAISTLGSPDADLAEVLRLAKEFGLAAIELRMLERSIQLPELWKRQDVTPARLAATVRAAGVVVPMIGTSLRLIGNTAAEREELLALVPFAEALGTAHLRVFDGGDGWNSVAAAEARATLDWWAAWKRENGCAVEIAIETHDSLLSAEVLRDFVRHMPECHVVWDTHHTWRKGGESPAQTWDAIRPHVVHIHVKDSVKKGTSGFDLTLPGAGEFPMTELRNVLAESRWMRTVSLEWERGWHPELPPLAAALAECECRGWW